MISLVLVSLGTDLPEIIYSIVGASSGHADIVTGDALGSVLTQITLVLGLLPFIGRSLKVKRKEVAVMGGTLILSLLLVSSIFENGYISRLNALFLVGSWPIYMLLTHFTIPRRKIEKAVELDRPGSTKLHYVLVSVFGYAGVAIGAYAVLQSILGLSEFFSIPEFFLSFFLASFGTSLPELAVNITAIRARQYEIAIGDTIGSCIIDASVSVGIGFLFYPQAISGGVANLTTIFTIFASLLVISLLGLREKVDKRSGIIFILVYLFSFILLQVFIF
jgi:cation:H+ antiporter